MRGPVHKQACLGGRRTGKCVNDSASRGAAPEADSMHSSIVEGFDPEFLIRFQDAKVDECRLRRLITIDRAAEAERPNVCCTVAFHLAVQVSAWVRQTLGRSASAARSI